jgi:carbamoyltransferase
LAAALLSLKNARIIYTLFSMMHPMQSLRTNDSLRSRSADGGRRPSSRRAETLVVGISGARQNATAAVALGSQLVGCCEWERLTRVRSIRLTPGFLPTEAVDAALLVAGCGRDDIEAYATAESSTILPAGLPTVHVEHHLAHAATAALTSPFNDAAVLICDHHSTPSVTVWSFHDGQLTNEYWPWMSEGFAQLYSECAELFGFAPGQEHRLEALARLAPGHDADQLALYLDYRDRSLQVNPLWKSGIRDWLSHSDSATLLGSAALASSIQRRLADLLVSFLSEVKLVLRHETLCLGGGLFYNTYLNTRIAESGLFKEVFVPLNPGNAGLAAGAAMLVGGRNDVGRVNGKATSPFLGPGFSSEQIKATLDNCKLTYEYLGEADLIRTVVEALVSGRLVAWFQDRMEWGPRALGNRSILASPFSPYVLDNLNTFLKQRERHRAYGVSVLEEEASRHFIGPNRSPHMEFEYRLVDPPRFRHVVPDGAMTLRVQTVGEHSPLFREVHSAWAAATGCGVLVNTSFNGFSEPIVCSPRDAVRVFFGTGLDMLVLGQFVIRK